MHIFTGEMGHMELLGLYEHTVISHQIQCMYVYTSIKK